LGQPVTLTGGLGRAQIGWSAAQPELIYEKGCPWAAHGHLCCPDPAGNPWAAHGPLVGLSEDKYLNFEVRRGDGVGKFPLLWLALFLWFTNTFGWGSSLRALDVSLIRSCCSSCGGGTMWWRKFLSRRPRWRNHLNVILVWSKAAISHWDGSQGLRVQR
jgi:hypothetical protein